MKIGCIVGVRPEFIRASIVSKELRKQHEEILIHTGQHYDYQMNSVFFDELNISKPKYFLEVGSGSHGYQIGEMIKRIEKVLIKERPEIVLLHGDTNSTLAGSLAASKLHIKIAHVEAGLRSFDRSMPEEINRILVDHCSDLLFCPTNNAVWNLKNEGISKGVYLTGDLTVDSLFAYKAIAEKKSNILKKLNLENKDFLVATLHRAENIDNIGDLKNIVDAFSEIKENIVFPLHPRTEKTLKKYNLYDKFAETVQLTEPLGFLDFLQLMSASRMILTDSGGIQKEAYILKIPCITLRKNTEWIETIKDGWNILVGANKKKIIEAISEFKPSSNTYSNRFGEGDAVQKIMSAVNEKI